MEATVSRELANRLQAKQLTCDSKRQPVLESLGTAYGSVNEAINSWDPRGNPTPGQGFSFTQNPLLSKARSSQCNALPLWTPSMWGRKGVTCKAPAARPEEGGPSAGPDVDRTTEGTTKRRSPKHLQEHCQVPVLTSESTPPVAHIH